MTYFVVDVGGTFIKYALMDDHGNFLEKGKIPTQLNSSDDFIDSLYNLYQNYPEVSGIAISSAGVIDSDRGVMHTGGSLDFIENLDIVSLLEERCHVPVTIENDAKCAALAELWKGTLSDCQNAITMVFGTAVGGAVIINRHILKGPDLLAGEFSYILTDSSDSLNWRKNFAINGGVPALIKSVATAKKRSENNITGEKIFEWINEGDYQILEILREYTHLIAVQIVNLHFIINPEKFAIGGGISERPLFIQLIQEEVEKLIHSYPFTIPNPKVVACAYHSVSNLVGALYHHLVKVNNFSIENV